MRPNGSETYNRVLCELAQLRGAYGVATAREMQAMALAFPCRMCFVPEALHPPGLPWPSHEEHVAWANQAAAV